MSLFRANNRLIAINGILLKVKAIGVFVFKIDTTKGNGFNSFKIPTRTGYLYDFQYRVNYNGAWTNVTAWNQAETLINFPSAGIYTIEIRGSIGSWYDNNTGDVQKYVELISFGDVLFGNLVGMFYGAINLKFSGDHTNRLVVNGPNAPIATGADSFMRASGVQYVPAKLFKRMQKIVFLTNTLYFCTSIVGDIYADMLDSIPNVVVITGFMQGVTGATGSAPSLKNCKNITSLQNFMYQMRNLALPTDLFDLPSIYKITNWGSCLRVTSTTYSHTGTLQPIWDYELETASFKSTAFAGCTALTNYTIHRSNWP